MPRDANPDPLVDHHIETMYDQRKSNGDHVPVPSHTPADDSQAKFFQPGAATG